VSGVVEKGETEEEVLPPATWGGEERTMGPSVAERKDVNERRCRNQLQKSGGGQGASRLTIKEKWSKLQEGGEQSGGGENIGKEKKETRWVRIVARSSAGHYGAKHCAEWEAQVVQVILGRRGSGEKSGYEGEGNTEGGREKEMCVDSGHRILESS